ncbi:WS/DGAT domain-containing protein [Actinomadura litoris]|uniref:WS/DGAT domain-containing protein n=1 Tax=Actinomadura litoris TaxID=2678616 RepID=UPI001FA7C5AA|nr:WS/DGAT domain-containing protein [Actinomadura litoris]
MARPISVRAAVASATLNDVYSASFAALDAGTGQRALPSERGALGNRLAAIRIALPCAESESQATAALARFARFLPAEVLRAIGEPCFDPRLVNLMASNISGPSESVALGGAALRPLVAINFLPDRHGLSAVLMGHRGRVTVGFNRRRRAACPGRASPALDGGARRAVPRG